MHNTDPGPSTVFATHVVELLGGPQDGEPNFRVPEHRHEFYDVPAPQTLAEMQSHYRYCPHASALFGKPCFIHSTVQHYLYAR